MKDDISSETFKYDWNLGVIKITKHARVIVTIILWIITAILSLTTLILLFTINNKWIIFSLYICSLPPSFLSYFFVYGFNKKCCCITPHVTFAIIFHGICIGSVIVTLIQVGVKEPTAVVIIIQSMYIFTQLIHLPFIKPYVDQFLS
ncbi:hypothetical protein ENUP19_0154G0017 [Entamoeba nuttalli]|uniref:Transmembrane protein n=2 Tax=Entamoeba nuttalli TaxID=412467 RepID=K2GWX8_ENTNP|nr:hypothetical protein ENU1_118660 [Entamoeba nuttalli P19]EKE39688.1 hypothetical protein ENU1_118660 [Entamoeba nuttalli P19]|eukprot:XP_008857982.1 hypothetical protein ENU1_118660 [Entamoeba nuttalli P19]